MDRKLHPKGQFRLSHFSSLSVKNIQQSMYHVFYQRPDSSIIISLCIRKTYSKICETYLRRIKNLSTFPTTIFQSYSNQAKCNTFFYHSMDKNSRSYQPGYHHHGGTYIDYVSLFLLHGLDIHFDVFYFSQPTYNRKYVLILSKMEGNIPRNERKRSDNSL